MKTALATCMMLACVGSALAADVYDNVYVSNPAVCERAGEADMNVVLFELQAAAVSPRQAIWVGGEMTCSLVDVRTMPSAMHWDPKDTEIMASARCYAPYQDYLDQLVITNVSQNINLHYGDTEEPVPPTVEIISMRADLGGEAMAAADGYDGIYTLCERLTPEDFEWPL
jgi:hypothetical protein